VSTVTFAFEPKSTPSVFAELVELLAKLVPSLAEPPVPVICAVLFPSNVSVAWSKWTPAVEPASTVDVRADPPTPTIVTDVPVPTVRVAPESMLMPAESAWLESELVSALASTDPLVPVRTSVPEVPT